MSRLKVERLEDRTVPAVIFNGAVPIDLDVFVPCANGGTGEVVHLSGQLHVLIDATPNAAGGLHLKEQAQPQGLSGVGLTTGDKYQGTGVTQEELNLTPGAAEFTFVNNFRIIGQGPGNNYLVHEVSHFTINADGTVTANFDKLSVECR
jgi:hypothetical protein